MEKQETKWFVDNGTPTWRRHTIYLPDLEEVSQIEGRDITEEEYDFIIEDLIESITYDDYKDVFIERIKENKPYREENK